MADVRIPGIGSVPKPALIAFVAGGVGIVGYAWWRHRSGVDTTATADTSAVDTSAVDTSGDIDPSTGVPYADEYGAGYSGIGLAGSGYYDQGTGAYISSGYGPTQLAPATTNAAWAQQVEATLASLGYDPVTVSAAIGKYLVGAQVTSDQEAIIQAAIGQQGYPPEGALPIHTQSTSTPPPKSTGGGTTTTKTTTGKMSGLHVSSKGRNHFVLDWNPVKGATGYTVYVSGKQIETVVYSTASVWNLKPHSTHLITVAAERNGKHFSHQSIHATTSK